MDFFMDFGSGNPEPGWHRFPGMILFVALGTTVYHVLGFRWLRSLLFQVYSRCSWWEYLTTYKGILSKNVQTEVQYVSIAGLHHLIGGGLMACGMLMQDPRVWAAGAMIGVLDDVHDMICMLLPAWPFGGEGASMDVQLTVLLLIHHSAALFTTFLTIIYGLHSKRHVQSIGAWLLLAGGVSHFTLALSRTRNRRDPRQARQDALVWLLGSCFYFYSRFYAFPGALAALFREDFAQLSLLLQAGMVSFALMMGTFNALIGLDVLRNTAKRLRTVLASFPVLQEKGCATLPAQKGAQAFRCSRRRGLAAQVPHKSHEA